MKFMKLGSSPDTFYTIEAVRSVSTEVTSDLIVQVKGSRYLLHKAPLLSKCLHLQKLCAECSISSSSYQQQTIQLPEFPGGEEAFEMCAKFCYGITITLNSLNIVSVRCAAEYLQMTEEAEKGNLVYKLEVFLNTSILRGWKDLIAALKSTASLPSWSEDLGITSRCIDAIASKVQAPEKRDYVRDNNAKCNGIGSQDHKPLGKSWWTEDITELCPELYWRTMVAIKSGRKLPARVIGEALQIYGSRHLPSISENAASTVQVHRDLSRELVKDVTSKHRSILESIVSLLPMEKGSVPCSFMLKLLKAANILGAAAASKMELGRRVGMQLDEASVSDLLIPSLSDTSETLYDIDIVLNILEEFMLQCQSPPTSPPRTKARLDSRRSRSVKNVNFEFQESRRSSSASHSSKLKVAKLVDGYLQEVAQDTNLPLSNMIALAESIPDFARPEHDDLYKAIDIYLKSHPDLNKSDRRKLCRVLDFKKLSKESCIHAVQNERLPLRVVVQLLLFEQARSMANGGQATDLPDRIHSLITTHNDDPSRVPFSPMETPTLQADARWSISSLKSLKLRLAALLMKPAKHANQISNNEAQQDDHDLGTSSKLKGLCLVFSGPKWMLGSCL
ncbi:hypothetical protein Syun_020418 [Stephania yunnanensis]|uniref:NPH3 domain-containing protein n=1 Tax=Stephania yunnanensis TaxID=152371 RepID=A0AAP0NRF6_9MAGN